MHRNMHSHHKASAAALQAADISTSSDSIATQAEEVSEPSSPSKRTRRSPGSVTRLRTPRRRSEDQRVNLRRSYQALLRKLKAGDSSEPSTYQTWPVRPYAASV